MRVYTKIVIDAEGQVIESESYNYEGPVAEAKGPSAPRPQYSVSGRVVANLFDRGQGPLGDSLRNILASPGDDPFTQRQADLLTQRTRAGFGARGMATSGIAAQAEQQALSDFLLNRGEQKTNQAISILGTGSAPPSFPGAQQGRGFMGLK